MVEIIISGGQTGADRAALDFAIAHGIAHGGWCPRGRMAEDGPLPRRYELTETPSRAYAQRTAWNVRDSEATVIFSVGARLEGGSLLTLDLARRLGRPALHLSRDRDPAPGQMLRGFLDSHRPRRLNIAGPRASKEPEVGAFVTAVLAATLTEASVVDPPRD